MGQGDPGGQYQSGLDRSGRTEIPYFRSTSPARPTSASVKVRSHGSAKARPVYLQQRT